LKLDPPFGERTTLAKFEHAFSLLETGFAGKILLTPMGLTVDRSLWPSAWRIDKDALLERLGRFSAVG
jgi:hypothetical protein